MSEYQINPDARVAALEGVLQQLDLRGAAGTIQRRLAQAKTEEWAPEQLLASLLADEVQHRAELATPRRLRVAADGRSFQVDERPAVSLVRRAALRRLLRTVLERRAAGGAATVQDLVQAGWPRETLTADQGATRVYTAVRTLRRLGLEDILLTSDRGYELVAEVDVSEQPS